MVTDLPQIIASFQVCEEYAISKQHRSQFPSGKSWKTKSVIELVHSNLYNAIKSLSNGGKKKI